MSTSVGMKARKKQSTLSHPPHAEEAISPRQTAVEQAMLSLESVCLRLLDATFTDVELDTDRLYWQQRFKNIATPVSLALAEYRGPRRFHYHYRHKNGNHDDLEPVAGPDPIELVAQACERALKQCQTKLGGVHDRDLIEAERSLEQGLQHFLTRYKNLTRA